MVTVSWKGRHEWQKNLTILENLDDETPLLRYSDDQSDQIWEQRAAYLFPECDIVDRQVGN